VLKFKVKIVSPEIEAESPEGLWTVNVHSCPIKENDWVTAKLPIETVEYNIIDYTESSTMATFEY